MLTYVCRAGDHPIGDCDPCMTQQLLPASGTPEAVQANPLQGRCLLSAQLEGGPLSSPWLAFLGMWCSPPGSSRFMDNSLGVRKLLCLKSSPLILNAPGQPTYCPQQLPSLDLPQLCLMYTVLLLILICWGLQPSTTLVSMQEGTLIQHFPKCLPRFHKLLQVFLQNRECTAFSKPI